MAQAIITKFAGPTNTRGSRIIVTSWLGRTTWNYDHALNAGENHAAAILHHIGDNYKVVGYHATDCWQWLGATPNGTGYVAVVI